MIQIMTNIERNNWILEILEFINFFKQVFQLLHFFSCWDLARPLYSIINLYNLICLQTWSLVLYLEKIKVQYYLKKPKIMSFCITKRWLTISNPQAFVKPRLPKGEDFY